MRISQIVRGKSKSRRKRGTVFHIAQLAQVAPLVSSGDQSSTRTLMSLRNVPTLSPTTKRPIASPQLCLLANRPSMTPHLMPSCACIPITNATVGEHSGVSVSVTQQLLIQLKPSSSSDIPRSQVSTNTHARQLQEEARSGIRDVTRRYRRWCTRDVPRPTGGR